MHGDRHCLDLLAQGHTFNLLLQNHSLWKYDSGKFMPLARKPASPGPGKTYPTEAKITSTGVSSVLLTVTCMVTPSAKASLDLTSKS